jgi:hypothetical protein
MRFVAGCECIVVLLGGVSDLAKPVTATMMLCMQLGGRLGFCMGRADGTKEKGIERE